MLKDALSRMVDVFPPALLMRGQEYQKKGFVLNIRLSEGLLKARVKGSSHHIYDVHMDLKSWPGKPARCSCPYQINCKHAAACLLALQAREKTEPNAPPQSFDVWLDSLREQEAEKNKPEKQYELVYLLTAQRNEFEHRILVHLALAKQLKKGGLGKKVIVNSITESRKQYFNAEDEAIVAGLLFKYSQDNWFEYFSIRNSELLEKIIATGRAYLVEEDDYPLALGETKPAHLKWQFELSGAQHLVLETEETVNPLMLDKPWYLDAESPEMGLLDIPYTASHLRALLNAPSVALEEAPLFAHKLSEIYPQLPQINTFEQKELLSLKPEPVLYFDAIELESGLLLTAKIAFQYQGVEIASTDATPRLYRVKDKILQDIVRDFTEEARLTSELEHLLVLRAPTFYEKINAPNPIQDALVLAQFQDEKELSRLYSVILPALKSKGWRIEFLHLFYEELVDAEELEWFSELNERGNDFFSYQLGILIDGKPMSIVPLVADLINQHGRENLDSLSDDTLIKLPIAEGKVLQVDFGRIKPLLRFLLQYGLKNIKPNENLEISRYQLILMQEAEQAMASLSARWQGGETIRNQLQQLITLTDIPSIEVPKGLQAVLRDYQMQGLNWLQFLRKSHFGGVLADDMGLGKTVQTLAHLLYEKEAGRLTRASLIVAPTSLVFNWFEEASRFTPQLKVLIFHGVRRHNDDFAGYDLIISTYGLIQRDKSRFMDYSFYYLILDEAQSIKNARTKTTQIIQQINASHRLCLSGTPLENHLGELWSLFHFLMPGLLGDAKQFRQFFKTPIEKMNDLEKKQLLANRVKPFLLRRNKNQVAKELPAKTEMTRMIELTGRQRDLYEAIRMSMEKKVREAIARQGMGKSHIVLLDALLKLRQVCCDPQLLSMKEAEIAYGNSAKLEALLELLENLMAEGRRVLIFSQFTSMLLLIEEQLKIRNYHYLKLTGKTQNRQALVNTFQEGKTPIFLISLKAGGTGLNLTSADTVIHYDPWWNPAVEDQATDRSHRIGQENPVFVYKLITTGTVEEAILTMQAKKRQLFDGILSDNASGMTGLTKTDIEQFFMPLSDA
ncbi:MAG: DEAD/DEAH box helicase [Tatlockia sp.]|jgi:SNF2 family DNA or RNA helicase